MSAIHPLIQTPPRMSPDPFNSGSGQTAAPAAPQGFSDTLTSVGAKPVRKNPAGKPQNAQGGGENLPVTGNPTPQPQPVPPATPNPAASAPASAAVAASAASPPAAPVAVNTTGATPSAPAGVTVDNAGAQNPLPGTLGDVAQAAPAAPSATSFTPDTPAIAGTASSSDRVSSMGDAAAAPAGQAQTAKVAAKSTASAPAAWVAGRGAAAMREIKPTGDGTSVGANQSADGSAGSANDAVANTSAPALPAAQINTAAMIESMQASSTVSASAGAGAAPQGAANADNTLVANLGLSAGTSDITSALPAMAAAAASTAQVIPTLAAGAGLDKKSHEDSIDTQTASGTSSPSDAAGAAQLLNTQASVHTQNNAVPTFKVNAAVDSPEFSQNVASHLSTMLDGNVNSAKLQVNPAALGPIEVRISIQGDHAQVWMASHSAMTREALQETAPKLREMLNAQGFAQVSVDISQRSFQERTPMAHAYEWQGDSKAASAVTASTSVAAASRVSSGILDAYA